MGLLDPTKIKFNKKMDELHGNIDRGMGEFRERIDQRVAEVKSYWQSMIGNLTNVFNKNPIYQMEYGTPEEFIMGEEFEQFTLNLFPDYDYILVRRTHDFLTNELRYVEECLFYDFTFRHRQSEYEFVIECKYRSNLVQDKLMWAKSKAQFDRYRNYEKENYSGRYYIMMGLGGVPGYPNELFLVPLSDIKYVGLFPSFLEKYKIAPYPMRCDGKTLCQ